MKQTIRLNENELKRFIAESVKRVMNEMDGTLPSFKHCHIDRHPLKDEYMVVNDTFEDIPPYFGTLKQCQKAAIAADKNAEKYLNSLIEKARQEGHSEEEISAAVERLLKRK